MEGEQHYIQVLLLFTTKTKSASSMRTVTNNVDSEFPKPRIKLIILTSIFFTLFFVWGIYGFLMKCQEKLKGFFVSDHYQIPTTLQKKKKLS
ncbi:hypothetical protein D8B45_08020 [Candidatus Gracilibacteria bacterium]|nr:MAG: hypothetical protein D8B45_08020 [Candidatus Gracilibacteria bacterium]